MKNSLSVARFLKLCIVPIALHGVPAHAGAYSHDAGIESSNADWMSKIADAQKLKRLSIPGTHDSMAFYGGDTTQTQSMSLGNQLVAGIRVLDIRWRRVDNRFEIHHGIIDQHASFDDVLIAVTNFLKAHPRETVLMRLSGDEDTPSNSTQSVAEIFKRYAEADSYKNFFWRDYEFDPSLSSVRGKIVVLCHFTGCGFGLSYSSIHIQDNYTVSSNWALYEKWQAVKAQLNSANASGQSDGFYMNYLSGSTGAFPYFVASGHSSHETKAPRLLTGLITPAFKSFYPDFPRVGCFSVVCSIAFEGTNTLVADYIGSANLKFAGIVMADFPGGELIEKIIKLNPVASGALAQIATGKLAVVGPVPVQAPVQAPVSLSQFREIFLGK